MMFAFWMKQNLKVNLIDDLIYTAVFSPDQATQEAACWLIRRAAVALGIMSASIQSFMRQWDEEN